MNKFGEIDRQEAVGLLGDQLHRQVVDLVRGDQGRHARRSDADWLGSNCGASCFKTLSTFHTTASALKDEPCGI